MSEGLTPRQAEAKRLFDRGLSRAEIATLMGVGVGMVSSHLAAVRAAEGRRSPQPGDVDYDWDAGPFAGAVVKIPLGDGSSLVRTSVPGEFEYWLDESTAKIWKRPVCVETIER